MKVVTLLRLVQKVLEASEVQQGVNLFQEYNQGPTYEENWLISFSDKVDDNDSKDTHLILKYQNEMKR